MSDKAKNSFENETDINEHKKVMFYYVLFFGSAAMVCVPLVYTAIVGFLICSLTIVGLYSTRSGAEEDGYLESHMIYLIHTFWYAGLFMFYSLIAAGLYLLGFATYLDFYGCLGSLPDIAVGAVKYGSASGFIEASSICWSLFVEKNQFHIMICQVIALTPIFFYLVYRFIKGWTLAVKHMIIRI